MNQQYQTGVPMMRALVLDNQDDENVYEIADQYMFGDNMMIAPVTTKGAITRSVYLPKGIWFNYWTNEKYEGKTNHHVVAPLDTLPIFVKGGSIIPMQPEMRYAGEKPVDVITLDIFPYGDSKYDLYEDDNLSLTYKTGDFAITTITSSLKAEGLTIKISKPKGNFKPTNHQYELKIRWSGKNQPKVMTENGVSLIANQYSGFVSPFVINKILTIRSKGNNQSDITYKIN